MRFFLSCSKRLHYEAEEREKLTQLGFAFWESWGGNWGIRQFSVEKEIGTLEELMAFVKEFGSIIILDGEAIEIYNGEREGNHD